jgi:uncharacterized glyoxalase superfamily protein PhnB
VVERGIRLRRTHQDRRESSGPTQHRCGPVAGGGSTYVIRVRVTDVAASFEQARACGARILEATTDRGYGERDCKVEDLAGHRWQFSESVSDVVPEEYGCQTIAPWPDSPIT